MNNGGHEIFQWNYATHSMLACLGSTLGVFNISRFAIFSVNFGGNFVLQFLLLTILIGVPLFVFHISFGQLMGTGVLNIWKISPIFKGVGIALLLSQAFVGVYSIIGISWLLPYFRDSFISKLDTYRWAEPLELFGQDGVRVTKLHNITYKLEQMIPEYFHGVVLHRKTVSNDFLTNVRSPIAFNLCIAWAIVFLSLHKGTKSYGKACCIFSILPVIAILLLSVKLSFFLPGVLKMRKILPQSDWSEFFLNSKSWLAAFSEVFLTWGIFGASAMQIATHNKPKHFLYRDAAFVILTTTIVLLLAAFLAYMCSQLLYLNHYVYIPSSYEQPSYFAFLRKEDTIKYTFPIRWICHGALLLGERTIYPPVNHSYIESGYQPLRLATELWPAMASAMGSDIVSPFWSILFYSSMICFAISQQLAVWHCVINGIFSINLKSLAPFYGKITWFCCFVGFGMGLPLTTQTGIFIVYFLDYIIGCGWWIMALYLTQFVAIFVVRGPPFTGSAILETMFAQSAVSIQSWMTPAFSFNWTVILPLTLLLVSTSIFKNGGYEVLYNWRIDKFYEYWPAWSGKVGCAIQLTPLAIVPLVAIIQCVRYLCECSDQDISNRMQSLLRPDIENVRNFRNDRNSQITRVASDENMRMEDYPPKYTPPPSYSAAVGVAIAKILRGRFQESMRRISNTLSTSENEGTMPLESPPLTT